MKEAGPQLLLQAFLQRILTPSAGSGPGEGGHIEREYGLGRQRSFKGIVFLCGACE